MQGRISRLLGVVILVLSGCTDQGHVDPPSVSGPSAELAQEFDGSATGTLQGKVTWEGPAPDAQPFRVYPDLGSQPDLPPWGERANPNAPKINPKNRGVAQAVVYLRQVDLRKSKPWHHEPVTVEQADWDLLIRQGSYATNVGFVRRGTSIDVVNRQKVLHILRGRGAAYFALPCPTPDVITTRRLERTGRIRLSSAADYFWMRAYLFVDDHPYYARTDENGQFELTQVPPGTYQISCWMPNWRVAFHERAPESGLICRVGFHPSMDKQQSATVETGKTATIDFVVTQRDFLRDRSKAKR